MKSNLLKILIIVLFIGIHTGCDQITKVYARNNLKGQGVIQVVDNIFILNYVENKGAFLGLGSNWPLGIKIVLLMTMPVIFLIAMIIYSFKVQSMSYLQIFGFCSIIGGGLSNVFDRIFFNGYVTDFMNIGIGNIRSGIFNFADLSIMLGAGILMFFYIKMTNPRKETIGPQQ